ncbi:hypothetical protein MKW98_006626 [Papaver atlanticum]|uniref:Neprosin PEP catalytic domain-containing protein n=1 Tax=Papaver atlanticum TaxID=357466 RepID=A0AAD4XTW8_9MAGN|nr:hypothetical protein MKW98_006626 [Papaver atlanticum]
MSFKDLIKLVALVTIFFSFSPENYYGAHGAKNRPSMGEDMEFEQQLKILNKPPIKTIRIKFGDAYDCINIYKQPSFDHPLLKNHKIQPNLVLKEEQINESASGRFSSTHFEISNNERCPMGTVPIRRTNKKELVNAKYFCKWVQTYSKRSTNFMRMHQHLELVRKTHWLNSTAQIWIQNGPDEDINSIEFRWEVHPILFGDNQTRVFGLWKFVDGFRRTGCYNMLCPGFVQVDPVYTLGEVLRISVDIKNPLYMHFQVQQDLKTGNWWLFDGPDYSPIGYWPKEIFPHLANNASEIKYGGVAGGKVPMKPTPPMGNGKLPTLEFGASCMMSMMEIVNDNGKLEEVNSSKLELKGSTTPDCYDTMLPQYISSSYGTVMFFWRTWRNLPTTMIYCNNQTWV